MAREMALAGVDRSELTPPPPVQEPKGFFNKLSNFWYHYKFVVLVVAFFAGLAIWFVVDFATENPPDYAVVVVTEEPLGEIWTDELRRYMADCAEDVDGDGHVEVDVENLSPYFYSEYAPTLGRADADRLQTVLASGEAMVFVFDPYCYDRFTGTVEAAASEGFTFFEPLDTDAEKYNKDIGAWNWLDDTRRENYDLSNLSQNMYFGVRKPQGTAGGSDSVKIAEDGKGLIARLIQSAVY